MQANEYACVAASVKLGKDVQLGKFINLYGCEIGDESKIGAFVEIQKNASVGRRCKISSHTFICEGVTIEDQVFVGHNVAFVNDSFPRATSATGDLQTAEDWVVEKTLVKKGASIGSGATILANVTIGERAIVGAGSVVTRDVPPTSSLLETPLESFVESTHLQGARNEHSRSSRHGIYRAPAPLRRSCRCDWLRILGS
jgi:acetyltransferase-like isoleucine patch superfamily enzyme